MSRTQKTSITQETSKISRFVKQVHYVVLPPVFLSIQPLRQHCTFNDNHCDSTSSVAAAAAVPSHTRTRHFRSSDGCVAADVDAVAYENVSTPAEVLHDEEVTLAPGPISGNDGATLTSASSPSSSKNLSLTIAWLAFDFDFQMGIVSLGRGKKFILLRWYLSLFYYF